MGHPSISEVIARVVPALAVAAILTIATVAPASAAGTPGLIKDINPSGSSNPTDLTKVGKNVFFVADDGTHGRELWKTNGTAAGTVLVMDIKPGAAGSNPTELTDVAGTLYFLAGDGVHGRELWKSDGTAAGTVLVTDLKPGSGSPALSTLTAVGSRLFFYRHVAATGCCDLDSDDLWVSDGTAAGTHRVQDTGLELFTPAAFAGQLFYGNNGGELWRSNGTVTRQIEFKGVAWGGSHDLTKVGSRLFFGYDDWLTNHDVALYRTDANGSPLKKLADLEYTIGPIVPFGKGVMFIAGEYLNELWVSDGSVAGTHQIYDLGPFENIWNPGVELLPVGGDVYVTTVTDDDVAHLYRTDGTSAGVVQVAQAYAESLVNVGGTFCFTQYNWPDTWSLWCIPTSGTPPQLVATYQNFEDGSGIWSDDLPRVVLGGRLYYPANDGVNGTELWGYAP